MEPGIRRDASCAHHRIPHRPRFRAAAIRRIVGERVMTSSRGSVLAIDQGTTGSTCLVVNADGRVVGRGYGEITGHYPRPGWVEHDAEEILLRTVAAARDAIEGARAAGHSLPACIGITNQ